MGFMPGTAELGAARCCVVAPGSYRRFPRPLPLAGASGAGLATLEEKMSDEKKQIRGCMASVLSLFIQTPIWGAILYGVLSASGAETWVWVLFWLYLPICVALGMFRAVAELE